MNIPKHILPKLKCVNCEDLLSCGPVLQKRNGDNICGRCSTINYKEQPVLNQPYNELATMCMFPCKYEAEGCVEKVSFTCMQEHEAGCEYRPYICPVMPRGECEWIGPRNLILHHVATTHSVKLLKQNGDLNYNIRKQSMRTFIMHVFNILFLVQSKVCLSSYTIYHSVRRIGGENDNKKFEYDLKVTNKNGNITKTGAVEPQGSLIMKKATSIAIKMNTLAEILSDFQDAIFTITLKKYMKCYECQNYLPTEEIHTCDEINNIFFCRTCLPIYTPCKNIFKGCIWKGSHDYINHKNLMCPYTIYCEICNKNINEFNMLDHIRQKNHAVYDITHLNGIFWTIKTETIKEDENSVRRFFIQGPTKCINKTKCMLILRNPKTKFASYYIMNEGFFIKLGLFGWTIDLQEEEIKYFINNNQFDTGVDIYYND